MRTRVPGVLAGAAALAALTVACGPPRAEAPTLPPVLPATARFACGPDTVTATFYDDRVILEGLARPMTLPHVVAASGARYSDGTFTFWNTGREATLEARGESLQCRPLPDPWQDAVARGLRFRAVGQEPGWLLEIDAGRRARLVYDYGQREALLAVPPPAQTPTVTTYDATTAAHRLRVEIQHRACADAMSGEVSATSVAVTIDGTVLDGCGRFLDR